MARGTVSVPLDEALIEQARAIAQTRHMTLEAYLAHLVQAALLPPPGADVLGPVTTGQSSSAILPPLTDDEIRNTISDALAAKQDDAGGAPN